ncbi:MAG TPA: cation-translocating P-type ATPase, partial [Armatimonadetes bacterium]|nr:cation-translocating P-type ATPase [Armatimonadota bacterium]
MPSVSLRLSLRLPPRWSGEQAQALTQALQQWPQVTALLRGEELHLTYDPDRVSILDLQQTAAEQGATFTPPFLRVEGQLSPPPDGDEAARLEKRLAKFPGVVWAGVNFASAQAVVEGTLDETAVAALRSHLRRWGYDFDLSPLVTAAPGAVPPPERRASRVRRREWLWVALAAVALLLGWALEHLEGATRAARTAYVLSLLGSGGRFAWQVLRSQNLSGRGWILLAALGVLALGEWWEAALTMLGGAVGWAATEGLGERVRRAIGRERVLFAETVRRLTPDEERYCLAEELRPGDRFAVRPGEIIGADGQVVEGTSSVDEVALKGTSTPRKVSPGDFVCAGTLNQEGQLVVEAQRTGADTLWARRSRHLALATVFSLPADQWFARLGTALLLLLTAGLAGAPWLLGNLEPTTGYLRAWAGVALISAVGWRRSSQAVAVAVALVRLFRRGIWSRGGAVLETMPCTEVAVFEGAGVLTTGRPEEIDPVSLSLRDPQDILRLAAALARASSEPVAQAIVERARRERLARPRASSVRAVPGRGMQGDIAGRWHYLGGLSFARDLGLEAPEAERRAAAGETVWLLMTEREVLGLIVVPNPVRETAAQTVAAL